MDDDRATKPPKAQYQDARRAMRRLMMDARPVFPPGLPALAALNSSPQLIAALDVRVEKAGATPWVAYEVFVYLHGRPRARARLALYDGRTDDVLRDLEMDVTSGAPARLPGRFPFAGDCELWCEVHLLDDPTARATAFAWVVAPGAEWRPRRANAAVPALRPLRPAPAPADGGRAAAPQDGAGAATPRDEDPS
ncbi:MAG TPA: hypothetical protein VG389_27955 [Myxococcota bacterium]|jgi:hypothetical protein|nr:hypothetical protein [Myxococcota bacterium]